MVVIKVSQIGSSWIVCTYPMNCKSLTSQHTVKRFYQHFICSFEFLKVLFHIWMKGLFYLDFSFLYNSCVVVSLINSVIENTRSIDGHICWFSQMILSTVRQWFTFAKVLWWCYPLCNLRAWHYFFLSNLLKVGTLLMLTLLAPVCLHHSSIFKR